LFFFDFMIQLFEDVELSVTIHASCCGRRLRAAVWEAIRQQVITPQVLALRCKRVLGVGAGAAGHPLQARVCCDVIKSVAIAGDVVRVTVKSVNEMGVRCEGLGCDVFLPQALMPVPMKQLVSGVWALKDVELICGETRVVVRVLRPDADGVVVGAPLFVGDDGGRKRIFSELQ
jgi:DNA-directed RNA polymerase subunit E'/Rpb7